MLTVQAKKELGTPANDLEKGILEYIEPLCDEAICSVIINKQLSLKKCWNFCHGKGKTFAVGGCAAITPEQHFGWVREYFGIKDEPKSDKVIQFSPKPEAARSPSLGLDIDFDSLL